MRQGRYQALRYLTEPRRLLPRVDVSARKRRQDAERHPVFLLADRGAKKLVELVFEEKHPMDIRHFISPRSTAQCTKWRGGAGVSPDLSCSKLSREQGVASGSETTQSSS